MQPVAQPVTPAKPRDGAASVEHCLSQERKKRQKGSAAAQPPPDVPAISLAPFFDGGEEGKRKVAEQWDRACREVGFIKIVDHRVPKEVIDACWREAETFFERPMPEKQSVATADGYPYGYIAKGGENLLASLDKDVKNPPDMKEMFNICIGSDAPAADHPPPRWPADSAPLQSAWSQYNAALSELAGTLYKVCALALGLEEDWFAPKNTQHRNVIRAIHYPEQKPPDVPMPGQVRASMHTDYGALTILRLGGKFPGGLQAMGVTGTWVDVTATAEENAFVINLGDLMARWTNDRWLSTPHQVINPPSELAAQARRLSIAYFCNINMDAMVECIPTCAGEEGAQYAPVAAGEWLMRKHQQTVSGQLCYQKGSELE